MSVTDTPVRLPIPPLPRGFRMGAVHAGIKRNASREDVTLVVSDEPATAAGVYTTNLVFAAPVAVDRERTPGRGFRGVVINSGNANACTGSRGIDDARTMAALAGRALGVAGEEILVLSTGIIGEFLPMATLEKGIAAAAAMPFSSVAIGRNSPMMPVESTRISSPATPRARPARAAMVRASSMPRLPVQALALPELMTTPRKPRPGVRSRSTATGAANTRLVV